VQAVRKNEPVSLELLDVHGDPGYTQLLALLVREVVHLQAQRERQKCISLDRDMLENAEEHPDFVHHFSRDGGDCAGLVI
jgi:hypothetical protein